MSSPREPVKQAEGELFSVLEMPVFRKRYPPEVLRPRAIHTERVARSLRQRLGLRSVLGVAFYQWHDQTTLWWFEQGMLTLLAATGWETLWVTDARYTFDDDRFAELDGAVTIVRHPRDEPNWQPPAGRFDAVISLFPCDQATHAARVLGARLITFAVKNLLTDLKGNPLDAALTERPPDGTPLWHAFAGSWNFQGAAIGKLGETGPAWHLNGAPFPTNRYYFPMRPSPEPVFDALLFGSNSRDYDTAFAALARGGARRVAAIANEEHVGDVDRSARGHGLDAEVNPPVPHVRLLELLEQTRIVVNPIMPPAESHYSLSVPLALGRPIVATDMPSTRPFEGPGFLLAGAGDVDRWTACIIRLLRETADGMPHRGALEQGAVRHDVDRFFGSAILATMTGRREHG